MTLLTVLPALTAKKTLNKMKVGFMIENQT